MGLLSGRPGMGLLCLMGRGVELGCCEGGSVHWYPRITLCRSINFSVMWEWHNWGHQEVWM